MQSIFGSTYNFFALFGISHTLSKSTAVIWNRRYIAIASVSAMYKISTQSISSVYCVHGLVISQKIQVNGLYLSCLENGF